MEKDTAYPGLVELEALALDLHREAGFDTPRYWLAEIGEVPVIAVERFDRDVNNAPRVNETLLSVLATAKKDITRRDGADYEHIASLIQLARFPLFADKKQAARHLLKRLLLALFSGNGDLHLENLSLTGEPAAYRFSPVYDPTPMRAYSIHNMLAPCLLEVMAIWMRTATPSTCGWPWNVLPPAWGCASRPWTGCCRNCGRWWNPCRIASMACRGCPPSTRTGWSGW